MHQNNHDLRDSQSCSLAVARQTHTFCQLVRPSVQSWVSLKDSTGLKMRKVDVLWILNLLLIGAMAVGPAIDVTNCRPVAVGHDVYAS